MGAHTHTHTHTYMYIYTQTLTHAFWVTFHKLFSIIFWNFGTFLLIKVLYLSSLLNLFAYPFFFSSVYIFLLDQNFWSTLPYLDFILLLFRGECPFGRSICNQTWTFWMMFWDSTSIYLQSRASPMMLPHSFFTFVMFFFFGFQVTHLFFQTKG